MLLKVQMLSGKSLAYIWTGLGQGLVHKAPCWLSKQWRVCLNSDVWVSIFASSVNEPVIAEFWRIFPSRQSCGVSCVALKLFLKCFLICQIDIEKFKRAFDEMISPEGHLVFVSWNDFIICALSAKTNQLLLFILINFTNSYLTSRICIRMVLCNSVRVSCEPVDMSIFIHTLSSDILLIIGDTDPKKRRREVKDKRYDYFSAYLLLLLLHRYIFVTMFPMSLGVYSGIYDDRGCKNKRFIQTPPPHPIELHCRILRWWVTTWRPLFELASPSGPLWYCK